MKEAIDKYLKAAGLVPEEKMDIIEANQFSEMLYEMIIMRAQQGYSLPEICNDIADFIAYMKPVGIKVVNGRLPLLENLPIETVQQ